MNLINADLDMKLNTQGVDNITLAELITNTCLESTDRYAVDFNWPSFDHAILTVKEFVEKLKINRTKKFDVFLY
ncbi:unnamed protein product [Adineta steineri]|uniref:Uncharacterized protein n=1 Tax=Adineta steineri TaxID=433720 RepID=A0A816CCK8_9BILA|nr:unnamed protein product [Adineta steineri]CAF1620189.1 unnamed protein product [Adineta steineri]